MMKQPQVFHRPEDWADHVGVDLITNGMANFFRSLGKFFIKIFASLSLVFLRSRTGSKFITLSTLIWGWMLLAFTSALESISRLDIGLLTGSAPSDPGSVTLVWGHIVLFLGVGFYRFFEARRNLRRNDGNERFSDEPGFSILWPLLYPLLRPTGLVPLGQLAEEWWELTEYRFQKYVEPLLVILLAFLMITLGYSVYGGLLFLSGLGCFALFMSYEDAYFRQKQQKWDASLMSEIATDVDQPLQREQGMIVQQTLLRTSGFDKWQHRFDNSPIFDTAEAITDNGRRSRASH